MRRFLEGDVGVYCLEIKRMGRRKCVFGGVFLLLFVLIFFVIFRIEKLPVDGDGIAEITLELDKVIKHDVIYPTELLSIDQTQKKITVRVKFPDEGWRQFSGRETEKMDGIGYLIRSVEDDRAVISVLFPFHSNHYRLSYRWE